MLCRLPQVASAVLLPRMPCPAVHAVFVIEVSGNVTMKLSEFLKFVLVAQRQIFRRLLCFLADGNTVRAGVRASMNMYSGTSSGSRCKVSAVAFVDVPDNVAEC